MNPTDQFEALPEDHPLIRRMLEKLHPETRYMRRGRAISSVMRKNAPTTADSTYRNLKTVPYMREVAGGGYKNRH